MTMACQDGTNLGRWFGILLAVGMSLVSCSGTSLAQGTQPGQSDRISRLIQRLRSDSYQEREDAAEKLKDIGTPALEAVRTASQTGDLDFRRLSGKVVKYLEQIKAVRTVNGAEFRLTADPIWHIPEPGKESPVRIALAITNRTDLKLKVGLLSTVNFVLVTRDGQYVSGVSGASDRLRYPDITKSLPLIESGDTFTWSQFNARLMWWHGRDLQLVGENGFGIPWSFQDLQAGRYLLYVHYSQPNPFVISGVKVWAGQTSSNSVAIQIDQGTRK
jgi:hypothetical protein